MGEIAFLKVADRLLRCLPAIEEVDVAVGGAVGVGVGVDVGAAALGVQVAYMSVAPSTWTGRRRAGKLVSREAAPSHLNQSGRQVRRMARTAMRIPGGSLIAQQAPPAKQRAPLQLRLASSPNG